MSRLSSISSPRGDRASLIRAALALGGGGTLTLLAMSGRVGRPPTLLEIAVGWVVLACGMALWRFRPGSVAPGALMVLTGLAWLAGGVLYRGPLAHLLLAWPTGRVAGPLRMVVGLAYADAIAESLMPSDLLTVAYGLVLAGTTLVRLRTSTGLVRRGRLPATAGAVAIGGLLAADAVADLAGGRIPGSAVVTVFGLMVAGVAVMLTLDARWGGRPRGAATGLVVELGSRDGTSLRDRLAALLGDPTLEVAYTRARGGYADETGRSVEMPEPGAGRSTMEVHDDGRVVAMIVHDPSVLDNPELADAVAAATRIAVANARLRTEIDTRVAELDASQRRILTAADDQRRHIELRLAAGALPRLDRVQLLVRDQSEDGSAPTAPIDLVPAAHAAGDELRSFARGVYPPALTSSGLAAAVQELADAGAIPVAVSIQSPRLPADVEATAYFVCAEALANAAKHARAGRVTVTGRWGAGQLRLLVSDDGIGGADPHGSGLRGVRDRIVALGGTMDVDSPADGGTTVRAVIPAAPTRGVGFEGRD